jgi:hypothetical protein
LASFFLRTHQLARRRPSHCHNNQPERQDNPFGPPTANRTIALALPITRSLP